jgi:hypothetical protein
VIRRLLQVVDWYVETVTDAAEMVLTVCSGWTMFRGAGDTYPAGSCPFDEVGVDYCVEHHGIRNEDMNHCDMLDLQSLSATWCEFRPLLLGAQRD